MKVIGIPAWIKKNPSDTPSFEKHVQRAIDVRTNEWGGVTFVPLPPAPRTAKEVSAFISKLTSEKCNAILLSRENDAAEHLFGPIMGIEDKDKILVLRFNGQLDVLTGFSCGRGVFEFCTAKSEARALNTLART